MAASSPCWDDARLDDASAARLLATQDHHRATLLAGVHALSLPGTTAGGVSIFARDGFAIFTTLGADGPFAIAAAAQHGRGRIVAFAHDALLADGWEGRPHARFVYNCIAWAGQGRSTRTSVGTIEAGSVALLTPNDAFEPEAAAEFVRSGGGIVCASCPWGWQSLNGGAALSTHPFNRLMYPAGLAFNGLFSTPPEEGWPVASPHSDVMAVHASAWAFFHHFGDGAEGSAGTLILSLPPSAIVASSSPIEEARACMGGVHGSSGPWWAPVGQEHWIEVDLGERVEI